MNDEYNSVYLYTLYKTWGGKVVINNKAQVRLASTAKEAALQLALDWENKDRFEKHEKHLYRVNMKTLTMTEIAIPTVTINDE